MPSSSSSRSKRQGPIRVGMIGGGTVGGGVYELLMGSRIRRMFQITKICVQDLSKPRTFHLEEYTTLTTNVDSILNDPEIDMVVEVMSEQRPVHKKHHPDTISEEEDNNTKSKPDDDGNSNLLLAKRIVETALKQNKYVVTANKSLIVEYMDEFEPLLARNNKHGRFGYEATVCGGIPIIQILQSCYTGDTIHRIQAICNGTTNYMLGKMSTLDYNFEDSLQEAQSLGYTTDTANPSLDIDGYDARIKICVLAKLAFGQTVPPAQVPCKGISELSKVDFEYANLMGCTIKLLGIAQRLHEAREWDGPLCVFVSPVMIPKSHILAHVQSKTNAVAVTSANMGNTCYTGPGAGRFPTANSVVADMVRLAKGQQAVPPFPPSSSATSTTSSIANNNNNSNNHHHESSTASYHHQLELDHDYTSTFYIRIPFSDGLGIIKRVGELAEHAGVSIHSILQNPIRDRASADFVVTTEEAKVSQVTELCDLINQEQEFCRAPCMFMPMLMVFEHDSLYE